MHKNVCFYRDFIEGLPGKSKFYSPLSDKHISDDDYELVAKRQKPFKMKSMKQYHNLYLKCDLLLLADKFEKFRGVFLDSYKLHPFH